MLLRKTERRPRSRAAFTLVEMLVVVAIIVVLAGIAVPITFSVYDSAQRDTASAVIKGTLAPAVERYRLDKEVNPEGGCRAVSRTSLTARKPDSRPTS